MLALCATCLLDPPAGALSPSAAEQLQIFATCTGRYSAIMEHEWLMGRDGTQARESRALFLSLLESVRDDAPLPGHRLLDLRLTAKHAFAALLRAADLGTDPVRARRARAVAHNQMGLCRALLLS